jgi:hypothetical protein
MQRAEGRGDGATLVTLMRLLAVEGPTTPPAGTPADRSSS